MYNDELLELIFPNPKKIIREEGFLTIGELGESKCVIIADGNDTLVKEAASLLSGKMAGMTGIYPIISHDNVLEQNEKVVVRMTVLKVYENNYKSTLGNEEAYCISINKLGIELSAVEGKGILHAVQTIIQLLQLNENQLILPYVKIEDWPDMKYRGLFIEDRYGSDFMSLQDWKNAIDYMASLKMNFLGVGVYGCWCIQYDNQISEYWYLLIKKYPELKTPSVIRYYSPLKGQWEVIDHLPEMYKEDFFSELIAYGKKRNVTVRPHFNSMGHNTLIPHKYPEVSAKDSSGKPTGYGFCTSNDRTYEILFDIYDEVIDSYLKPNGIDWFHMGLDEVYGIIGVDPNDPFKKFLPWCHCEQCSNHTNEELFIEHIVRLAKHLKDKGIKNITMWQDQLAAMNLINENFVERLKEEKLQDSLIVSWWNYNTEIFETTKPELNIRRFITPMTGYYNWLPVTSYLVNIAKMLELGHREGIEGAEAYCTYDKGYDRNYFCYSEFTWNSAKAGIDGLDQFKERYVKKHLAADFYKAKKAFNYYDKLAEPGMEHDLIFYTLSYYIYSYAKEGKDYPRNFPGEVFSKLCEDIGKYKAVLKSVWEDSCDSCKLFEELIATMQYDHKLLENYKVDCLGYKILSNEFLKLLEINDKYVGCKDIVSEVMTTQCTLVEIIEELSLLITERKQYMLSYEKEKDKFLIPFVLKNASIYLQYLMDLKCYFDLSLDNIKTGGVFKALFEDLQDTRSITGKMSKLLR